MNILNRVGLNFIQNHIGFRLLHTGHRSKIITLAVRHFSEKPVIELDSQKLLYPLHNAVEEGNLLLVKQILKTDIEEVNGLNAEGELPLVIAAKKYTKDENYPGEILRLLHDYGACYLLDNLKGEEAGVILSANKKTVKNRLDVIIRIEAFLHANSGCGLPLKRCTSQCRKESKQYSIEFKARIALESLTSELTIDELASKHKVESWEIIKWRLQAREGLPTLFKD